MIENPNNESKRKHIYVCPTCKTENGLRDAKVINPQSFRIIQKTEACILPLMMVQAVI